MISITSTISRFDDRVPLLKEPEDPLLELAIILSLLKRRMPL